ncbi:MAG: DUF503 domain-containing protein [Armatimonadetes bacterium]|nr:DUF503 domain-containing protein [Armatimonadota bacterium]
MVVGICTVELIIPESNSLKDKRQVLKSLLTGIRQRFNVSVAEVGEQDTWRRAVLGIACISNDQAFTNQVLSKATDWIESNPRVQVLSIEMEFV